MLRLVPFFREGLPEVRTDSCGLNPSAAQLVTWKGTFSAEDAPSVLPSDPVICSFSQSVGLKINPGRSIVTLMCLISSGIPSRMCGIAYGPVLSVVIVNSAVNGSTSIFALTTTLPRLNGPATAGVTIDNPYGAPSYGPVRNTSLPVTLYGSPPKPTLTVAWPTRLSAPQDPASAAASSHGFSEDTRPKRPGGMCS